MESIQRNVKRLKEYKSRLIIFPFNKKKPHKGDSTEEELKMATQLTGVIMPLKNNSVVLTEKARVPTADEKKFHAYHTLRIIRADKKWKGKREKRAKLEAEKLDAPKK